MRISGINLLLLFCLLFLVTCDEEECQSPVVSTEPILTITAPVEDQAVADYITFKVNATDDVGIAKVEFYFDSELKTFDPTEPYECNINIINYAHGVEHTLYAVAYDTDNNSTGSSVVKVIVDTTLALPEASELSLEESDEDIISVYWSKNNDHDFMRYELFFNKSLLFSTDEPMEIYTSVDDTVYIANDLYDNTAYKIQVAVLDSTGNFVLSNLLEVTTTDIAPPQTDILRMINYPEYKLISWEAVNINDFYSYEIVRSIDSVYDSADEIVTTIYDMGIESYNYFTDDTGGYYFYLVVNDVSQNQAVSDYYYFNPSEQTNYALDFDGTTYATVPFVSSLNLGNNYTLEAWVYQRLRGDYDRVIDKSPTGLPYFEYSLISSAALRTDICKNGIPGRYSASSGIPLNAWHHIALTYASGTVTFYIDGEPAGTVETGALDNCSSETTLNIGRRKLYDEFYFRGIIDEVRVWNITRSEADIKATMDIPLIGNEPGLVVYFSFNEGGGNVIASPTGWNGYLGETAEVDVKDPIWTEQAAPIQ